MNWEEFEAGLAKQEHNEKVLHALLMVAALALSFVAAYLKSKPLLWVAVALWVGGNYWYYQHSLGRAWDCVRATWQRWTRGYAYVEAWNLNDYIAKYSLPRLKHLRDHGVAVHFADNAEESRQIMDDIIYALDLMVRDSFGSYEDVTEEEREEMYTEDSRYQRGLKLFGEHWLRMWD
jgi:hypothetical protein